MARLKLDNVFYETTNPSKIERLKALGAKEVVDGGIEKIKLPEFDNIKVDEIKAILVEKGIEFEDTAKKAYLYEVLKKAYNEEE